MQQISNHVFCDDFIAGLKLETRLMPSPYLDYPYLLIENFLPEALCRDIAEHANRESEAERARVKSTVLGTVVAPDVDESIRKTVIHPLSEIHRESYARSFALHQQSIEEYFRIALTTATDVQVLEYTKGAFYIKHADDSNELLNDKGETAGFLQVAPQRKITTVLFATTYDPVRNDPFHFGGGGLRFNYLFDAEGDPVTFYPKAGDMLVFPSNPLFSHEVLPVESGYRLTLVQWHNGIIA